MDLRAGTFQPAINSFILHLNAEGKSPKGIARPANRLTAGRVPVRLLPSPLQTIVPEFTASRRTKYGIPHAVACRALEVSQSWLCRWIKRRPTAREQRRNRLDEQIQRLFTASGGTYGSPAKRP
ncbi:hypothetical protein [Actinomadura welshii]|uniref:hypothetical protein n=1 Tax=Actinomadura welshii TaxID=3103817 RepID=UPI0004651305|nr:hypothetical protein [Actinomadura madurae]